MAAHTHTLLLPAAAPPPHEDTRWVKVHDAVYGVAVLPGWTRGVLAHPAFARMGGIAQCGALGAVRPAATHTRLQHSIGTAHLAGLLLTQLREHAGVEIVTPAWANRVLLAALAHDVGHGPGSHTLDRNLLPALLGGEGGGEGGVGAAVPPAAAGAAAPPEDAGAAAATEGLGAPAAPLYLQHEHRSMALLQRVAAEVGLQGVPGLDEGGVALAAQLIAGRPGGAPRGWAWVPPQPHETWAYDIVANAVCGVDVDRLDYLVRDAVALGVERQWHPGVHRLLHSARIARTNDGATCVAWEPCALPEVATVFLARARLHLLHYQSAESLLADVWWCRAAGCMGLGSVAATCGSGEGTPHPPGPLQCAGSSAKAAPREPAPPTGGDVAADAPTALAQCARDPWALLPLTDAWLVESARRSGVPSRREAAAALQTGAPGTCVCTRTLPPARSAVADAAAVREHLAAVLPRSVAADTYVRSAEPLWTGLEAHLLRVPVWSGGGGDCTEAPPTPRGLDALEAAAWEGLPLAHCVRQEAAVAAAAAEETWLGAAADLTGHMPAAHQLRQGCVYVLVTQPQHVGAVAAATSTLE